MGSLEKSRKLVGGAKTGRDRGSEDLGRCIKKLSKAINMLMEGDQEVDQLLLAEAYWLKVVWTYEAHPKRELLTEDAEKGLKAWVGSTQREQILPLVYNVADLLSLKGHMKLHAKLYIAVIELLKEKGKTLGECLGILWRARSFSHHLCTSPVSLEFIEALGKCYTETESFQVWTSGMGKEKALLLGFQQCFLVCDTLSTLRSTNLKHIHDDVIEAASALVLNDLQSSSSLFFAAHLYYDLAERMFVEGLTIEGCYNANKALTLRQDLFKKYFRYSHSHSGDRYKFTRGSFLLSEGFVVVGPNDTIDLNVCKITPWNVLKAFLESLLQIFQLLFSLAFAKVYVGLENQDDTMTHLDAQELLSAGSFVVSYSKCKALWKKLYIQEDGNMHQCRSNSQIMDFKLARTFYNKSRKSLRNPKWKTISVCEVGKASAVEMELCDALWSNDDSKNESHTRTHDDALSEVKCWHCLPSKVGTSDSMISKIKMKWECKFRRILLGSLIGIENSYIRGNEMQSHELNEVLLESVSVLVSRSTYWPSSFKDSKAFMTKLIENEIKADMFAIEQASILYNICLFSLRNIFKKRTRVKKCTRKDESRMLILPIQTVVAGLKLCFILCNEVPSLSQKVSRLLAAMYILSASHKTFPKLSCPGQLVESQLAAFFHQASVGAGFNCELFTHVRKQKDYTDTGPSRTIYDCRLAQKSVNHFEDFIQNFFEGLPGAAIVCVSILRDDIAKVLPIRSSNWLMVSRLISEHLPTVILLRIDDINEVDEDIPSPITIFNGHDHPDEFAEEYNDRWLSPFSPWGNSVIDDVAPVWRNILHTNDVMESFSEVIEDSCYIMISQVQNNGLSEVFRSKIVCLNLIKIPDILGSAPIIWNIVYEVNQGFIVLRESWL